MGTGRARMKVISLGRGGKRYVMSEVSVQSDVLRLYPVSVLTTEIPSVRPNFIFEEMATFCRRICLQGSFCQR